MARKNPSRSIGGESNLAERINRELASRNWSPADLADRMTAAGCPIQTSAIYKIIKGEPPRRITVDELLALVQVFETTIESLLTPVETLDKRRAQELLKELDEADEDWMKSVQRVIETYRKFFDLLSDDLEIYEYVAGYHSEANFTFEIEGAPAADLSAYVQGAYFGMRKLAGQSSYGAIKGTSNVGAPAATAQFSGEGTL